MAGDVGSDGATGTLQHYAGLGTDGSNQTSVYRVSGQDTVQQALHS